MSYNLKRVAEDPADMRREKIDDLSNSKTNVFPHAENTRQPQL